MKEDPAYFFFLSLFSSFFSHSTDKIIRNKSCCEIEWEKYVTHPLSQKDFILSRDKNRKINRKHVEYKL